jgi:hypothetical protein
LKASQPHYSDPEVTSYLLEGHPTVRPADLVHFAMGIFWKASAHGWRAGKPFILLRGYEEGVRKFLRGEGGFPADMALVLGILPMPVTLIGFQFPFATKGDTDDRTFHLYVPGLNFTLWTGTRISEEIRIACLSKKPNYVLVHNVAPHIARRYQDAFADAKKSRKLKLNLEKH